MPAIFLDRDGVVNENRSDYVKSWEEVDLIPAAIKALALAAVLPYKFILVTNQSAVGRGIISRQTADDINEQLVDKIQRAGGRIDRVYICPHAPQDDCHCRKPLPGMLQTAARDLNLDLTRSVMIGDALSDIAAGRAAGVRQTILLLTGRGAAQRLMLNGENDFARPDIIYPDLAAALDGIAANLR